MSKHWFTCGVCFHDLLEGRGLCSNQSCGTLLIEEDLSGSRNRTISLFVSVFIFMVVNGTARTIAVGIDEFTLITFASALMFLAVAWISILKLPKKRLWWVKGSMQFPAKIPLQEYEAVLRRAKDPYFIRLRQLEEDMRRECGGAQSAGGATASFDMKRKSS
jgi:hypothetical protein